MGRAFAFLIGIGLALGWLAPAPAHAESDPSVQSWRVAAPPRVAPSGETQTYRARRRYDAPRPKFQDDAALGLVLPDIAIAMPQAPDATRMPIAVVGDSLADALATGLEADANLKSEWFIRQKTVSASGLVREDFHNWPKTLTSMAAENPGLAALVVMVGLNDRQILRVGEANLEPLTEAWKEAYRKRIDAMIEAARGAKVPLIWIGLPVMRAPKLSADLAALNEMVRDRVTATGETYLDTYESFADPDGGFTATGPDIIGDTVRLRGADGIHFTPAGQRKLAFFVEKAIRKRIGDKPAPEAPVPVASLPTAPLVLPLPPSATATPIAIPVPAFRPRPDIGETRSLSVIGPASSLIGQVAAPLADPVPRDLFDKGIAPAPRAGRNDDYRWR